MELTITNNLDSRKWDDFILNHPEANILQSWAWGEFQEALGHKIWRFRVIENNKPIAQLLAIRLSLGFGKNIIYAPRDILINKTQPASHQLQAIKMIVQKIKEIAPEENAILFRVEPSILKNDSTMLSVYQSIGFTQSNRSMQPVENWLVDISIEESSILSQMKSKTRYNIRIAEKKDIRTAISQDVDDIQIFNSLNKETSARGHFIPHSNTYYKKQLETLGNNNSLTLFIAYFNDIPLASILVSFFGKKATYLHGVSSHLHKDKMASYALHWTAIQTAKEHGCDIYDMGGVDYTGEHPSWSGITKFKEGFGGRTIAYIGALELPLNPSWFKLYRLMRLFKK